MIHPIVRIDSEQYLQDLQAGNLYMKRPFSYQNNKDDFARGDKYDSAIPADQIETMLHNDIKEMNLKSQRIMYGNSYIKSFFHYSNRDCKRINEHSYCYYLSEEIKEKLKSFSASHVLIIFDLQSFISQFEDACTANKERCLFSDVTYLTQEQHQNELEKYFNRSQNEHINPCFIKNIDYKNQQEFRICVNHSYNFPFSSKTQHGIPYQFINSEEMEKPYSINIGSIEEYSTIMPFEQWIDCNLMVDFKNGKYAIG